MYAHQDVAIQQLKLEEPLFAAQVCVCVWQVHRVCRFSHELETNRSNSSHSSVYLGRGRDPMMCKTK